MLRLPSVLGDLIHEAILARITRSLAISLNAGLPLIQTLAVIARSAGNEYMAETVLAVRDAVERGDSLVARRSPASGCSRRSSCRWSRWARRPAS